MQQLVSITSQGQISIPANMRRQLGLNKYKKAWISLEEKRLVIEPMPDLMELAGSLKSFALKNKSIKQIRALEKKVVAETIVENYKKFLQ